MQGRRTSEILLNTAGHKPEARRTKDRLANCSGASQKPGSRQPPVALARFGCLGVGKLAGGQNLFRFPPVDHALPPSGTPTPQAEPSQALGWASHTSSKSSLAIFGLLMVVGKWEQWQETEKGAKVRSGISASGLPTPVCSGHSESSAWRWGSIAPLTLPFWSCRVHGLPTFASLEMLTLPESCSHFYQALLKSHNLKVPLMSSWDREDERTFRTVSKWVSAPWVGDSATQPSSPPLSVLLFYWEKNRIK